MKDIVHNMTWSTQYICSKNNRPVHRPSVFSLETVKHRMKIKLLGIYWLLPKFVENDRQTKKVTIVGNKIQGVTEKTPWTWQWAIVECYYITMYLYSAGRDNWLTVSSKTSYFGYNPFWVIQQQDTQQDSHYTIFTWKISLLISTATTSNTQNLI